MLTQQRGYHLLFIETILRNFDFVEIFSFLLRKIFVNFVKKCSLFYRKKHVNKKVCKYFVKLKLHKQET